MRLKINPAIKCTNKSQRNDCRGLKQDGDPPHRWLRAWGPHLGRVQPSSGRGCTAPWPGDRAPVQGTPSLQAGGQRSPRERPTRMDLKARVGPDFMMCKRQRGRTPWRALKNVLFQPALQRCLSSLHSEMHYSYITPSDCCPPLLNQQSNILFLSAGTGVNARLTQGIGGMFTSHSIKHTTRRKRGCI